jgi:hypothetical protein
VTANYEHLISIHGEEPPLPVSRRDLPVTDSQWEYLRMLENKTGHRLSSRSTYTRSEASDLIQQLKQQAESTTARVEYVEVELDDGRIHREGAVVMPGGDKVPAGRYAIPTPNKSNKHSFYKLWIGNRGGWKLYLQVSDDQYPVKRGDDMLVLAQIARDPRAASALYGQLIGSCGVCGRTLTNDESRALGIGPVCRTRF